MAHIADFMVNSNNSNNAGLNNMIARELSPDSSSSNSSRTNVGIGRRDQAQQHAKYHPQLTETAPTTATTTPTEEKERYVWRMHQPSESRKFTLFPAKDKLPSISTAAGRKGSDAERVTEQASSQSQGDGKNVLRKQQKEQTLVRRRKVSVPELGPMTTVQEVAMDSPTIPGRPPLHERSISAPGNSWRQHMFGESIISCISGPALDENAELENLPEHECMDAPSRPGSTSPKLPPISPKVLAPLVIPNVQSTAPRLLRSRSYSNRLRSDSGSRDPSAPDVPPKTGRMNMSVSPHPRVPFTPLSSTTTLVETPCSAPEGREQEKPWEKSAGPSPMGHSRGQSEATHQRSAHNLGHRRGESESSASIMDRGRPKKRQETGGSPMKRAMSKSKRSPSSEKKAFETLPQGHRAANVNTVLQRPELEALRKQAMGQASRFEVLNSKDVDALSRELRALDERCDYLRKTHKSLRSGRRNLHDRICSYLRSPRVARFSHESILKQEEALSELDTSIDDWATKLEYAENRRMRVRQKLLEHVAAALILPPKPEEEHQQEQQQGGRSYESSVHALSTPPRSPTKPQSRVPSPQRLAEPVPVQVASPERESSRSRKDVPSMASIKIYADSDVYALLADVEEEITRMGDQSQNPEGLAPSPELSQGNSGEMLSAATFQLPQRTYQATTAGFV